MVKLHIIICFLGELKIPKRHFEVNWPLETTTTSFESLKSPLYFQEFLWPSIFVESSGSAHLLFLGELKIQTRHFKINWPLENTTTSFESLTHPLPPWIFRNSYGPAFLWSRQAQLIRLMWNGGCVIEPRKGSIEVGGSLWYNGLVFALCQAIFRSAAAAAVAARCHCVFKWILGRHF